MASTRNSQNVVNHIKKRKADLASVFHSKCCICGFDAYPEALEFHHVHPEEKEFGITASDAVTKSLGKQLKELRKCILVCANCHRGIHQGYIEVPENYQELYDEERAQELLQHLDEIKHGKRHYCQRCGREIVTHDATYCVECAKIMARTVKWPPREELKALIRTNPFTQIADQFYVTDNAIRKWCDHYNLPRRKKDIATYSDEEWEKI